MDGMQQVFLLILMGLALILALVFTGTVTVVMTALSAKAWKALVAIDSNPALLAFDNTPTGRYLYNLAQAQQSKVDEASDPAVQAILHLPGVVNLYRAGIIDGKAVSDTMSRALGLTVDLLDGKPAEPPAGG